MAEKKGWTDTSYACNFHEALYAGKHRTALHALSLGTFPDYGREVILADRMFKDPRAYRDSLARELERLLELFDDWESIMNMNGFSVRTDIEENRTYEQTFPHVFHATRKRAILFAIRMVNAMNNGMLLKGVLSISKPKASRQENVLIHLMHDLCAMKVLTEHYIFNPDVYPFKDCVDLIANCPVMLESIGEQAKSAAKHAMALDDIMYESSIPVEEDRQNAKNDFAVLHPKAYLHVLEQEQELIQRLCYEISEVAEANDIPVHFRERDITPEDADAHVFHYYGSHPFLYAQVVSHFYEEGMDPRRIRLNPYMLGYASAMLQAAKEDLECMRMRVTSYLAKK